MSSGRTLQIARLFTLMVMIGLVCFSPVSEASVQEKLIPLFDAACMDCHDEDTETQLDLTKLSGDLSHAETFEKWEMIYDRVKSGEMPPPKRKRPDATLLNRALDDLGDELHRVSSTNIKANGRVPVRRLTRTEYEFALQDLLGIHVPLAKLLPAENDAYGFDTASTAQGLSPVHIQSYLNAADRALDDVLQLGPNPGKRVRPFNYLKSPYIRMWFDRPIRNGGQVIKEDGDEFVSFINKSYAVRSDAAGFRPRHSGLYRIEMDARGYQAFSPVTIAIIKASDKEGGTEVIGYFDLQPGESRRISVTSYFTRDHYFYPVPLDDDVTPKSQAGIFAFGAKTYPGEGIAIKNVVIKGPLGDQWPPRATRSFLGNVDWKAKEMTRGLWQRAFSPQGGKMKIYQVSPKTDWLNHLEGMIERFGPRALRRPLVDGEARAFAGLGKGAMDSRRSFDEVVRVAFRALFSSPQFLFHESKAGRLSDFALAERLAFFLWKSLPDEELFSIASEGRLSDPEVLKRQVDRMLNDSKSERFVNDFLDQWAGLKNIDATTPDDKLYPEYDDALRQSMLAETRHFFRDLIADNRSVRNLIDSDAVYVNRRLAEHYGIKGASDERIRRVKLPAGHVRGGLMTQASILKVTANGTVTSPVKRGAFVLSTVLGDPPSSSPLDIASIEPDTRGTTTIRETLDKHRDVESCASCHREIDPPGFALESFNPIGGYRERYRSTGKGDLAKTRVRGRWIREYRLGRDVDCSGITEEGKAFSDVREFKHLLMERYDEVARNLLENLVVYATGAKIQFADHRELDVIQSQLEMEDFGARSMIHSIVQSDIFKNK